MSYLLLMAAFPSPSGLSESSNGHFPSCSHPDKKVHTNKNTNIFIIKNNNNNLIAVRKSCIQIPTLSSLSFPTKFEEVFLVFLSI